MKFKDFLHEYTAWKVLETRGDKILQEVPNVDTKYHLADLRVQYKNGVELADLKQALDNRWVVSTPFGRKKTFKDRDAAVDYAFSLEYKSRF